MYRKPVYLRRFLLSFLFGVAIVSSLDTTHKSNLYFGVFISRESEFDFSGFIPPLELGVKTINDNDTVLKGLNEKNYYIKYVITNAEVRYALLLHYPIGYSYRYIAIAIAT